MPTPRTRRGSARRHPADLDHGLCGVDLRILGIRHGEVAQHRDVSGVDLRELLLRLLKLLGHGSVGVQRAAAP